MEFVDVTCPHTVAVVLKKFIFELPDRKLPFPDDLENITEEAVTKAISTFSRAMQRFWKKLFEMLKEVSSHSQVNKMTAFNLAVVFAPNFAPDTISVKCIEYSTKVIEFMILHYSSIFFSSPASIQITSSASPRSSSPHASFSSSLPLESSLRSPRSSSPPRSPRASLSPLKSPRAPSPPPLKSPRSTSSPSSLPSLKSPRATSPRPGSPCLESPHGSFSPIASPRASPQEEDLPFSD